MNEPLPPTTTEVQLPYAFHAGERLLQERAGVAERMAEVGPRVIRRFMPKQHRDFFKQLRYVIVGALDRQGRPWASILSGAEGFIDSPDATHLHVGTLPAVQDPLHDVLSPGAPVALLGIEAHTRRRNRANGRVDRSDAAGFGVEIAESFGNCPKYIQARTASNTTLKPELTVEVAHGLASHMRRMINDADTFFIASAHLEDGMHGVDVSHRGGKPGFVRVKGDELLLPDFSGNNLFNTLGNIAMEPRVGLLFIDYDHGDLLHVSGQAGIVFDGPEMESFAGAQRLLRITVEEARLRRQALALRWSEAELSPFLAGTGEW